MSTLLRRLAHNKGTNSFSKIDKNISSLKTSSRLDNPMYQQGSAYFKGLLMDAKSNIWRSNATSRSVWVEFSNVSLIYHIGKVERHMLFFKFKNV